MISTQEILASVTPRSPLNGRTTQDPCSQGTDSTGLPWLIISGPQSVWLSPSPTRALPLEPESSFPPIHAPHAKLLVQLLHFAQGSPLRGQLEYWLIPGVLASLTRSQQAAGFFPGFQARAAPSTHPHPNLCQLPQFLPWAGVRVHGTPSPSRKGSCVSRLLEQERFLQPPSWAVIQAAWP